MFVVYLPGGRPDAVTVSVQLLPVIGLVLTMGVEGGAWCTFRNRIVLYITQLLILQNFVRVLPQQVARDQRGVHHPAATKKCTSTLKSARRPKALLWFEFLRTSSIQQVLVLYR